MTHDEIVAHVAEGIFLVELSGAYTPYEVVRECRPSADSERRADVIVFDRESRRPVIVVEIKPTLPSERAAELAVAQVNGYENLLLMESPRATVFPLVVAESIDGSVDRSRWSQRAAIWTVDQFDHVITRRRLYAEMVRFRDHRGLDYDAAAAAMGGMTLNGPEAA